MAHAYAELIGERIRVGHRPYGAVLRSVLLREVSIIFMSFGPLVVVALVDTAGAGLTVAVLAGLWCVVALLAGWGLLAGRRGGLRGHELLLYVLLDATFGVALILLKGVF